MNFVTGQSYISAVALVDAGIGDSVVLMDYSWAGASGV